MKESEVRDWVRQVAVEAKTTVTFIEAARGGTSGAPDCVLLGTPIELKCWQRNFDGSFRAKLRREQVRFHYRMHLTGQRSLLLWNCSNPEPSMRKVFYALPGSMAPKSITARIAKRDYFIFSDFETYDFIYALRHKEFWRCVE